MSRQEQSRGGAGRIEHVQSGRQVNFLAIADMLAFFRRFGIDAALAGESEDKRGPG